ncbi:hypothetical protein T03_13213 [Trichinella britovi]|uniref:Uncharacterized protein n=1 Tax=Trichinella britovi TaxID=45882 RepID=A0A0V1CSG7_TRIBR|nr:hypothetical protein T03_13213 [Trichinella britovi]
MGIGDRDFDRYNREQLVLSVAESVFPWLTYITKTSYISRRRKLNPLANCDDDIPAFHCQRLYKIRYFGVEFALYAPIASCITYEPKFCVILTLCWILLAWERTFCAFRLVWSILVNHGSAFGKVVIATFESSIYVVHGCSEGGHLLMGSDTLDKEPEFIVVHQSFLISTN